MLEKIAKSLLSHQKIYIITHENPDGDALGSSFALKKALNLIGKEAEVVLNTKLPVSFEFTGWKPLVYSDDLSADLLVVLDLNMIKRAGESGLLFDKVEDKILIDHHLGCDINLPLILSDPTAAATGELVYKLIKILLSDIPRDVAEGIYIAIMTDTGGCRYSNTSATTHKTIAEIIDKIDHAYISRMVLEMMSHEKLDIFKYALNNFEFYNNGEICAVAIKNELIKNEDALNGIVNMALNIEGVKAGVLFKERGDNTTKVSLRTIGDINANKICSEFSGGGHKNAAGCTIELPLFKAKEVFIKLLSERI